MYYTNYKFQIESITDNGQEKNKILNACNEYKLDNKDILREGMGYKSIKTLFDNLMCNPLNTSFLNEPGL